METLKPKLRFPQFEGNLDYSYKKQSFEDVFLFSTGKNIKQNEASPQFETLCVRYGELYHMYNEVIKVVINRTNLDKSELIFSQGDEILLPSAGEDPLDIGSASALTVANVAIGRTINILKPLKQNVYSNIYAAYYINYKLRAKIATLAKGVSISNVYNSDLKTLDIILPSIEEQTRIANFLSSVDEKLNLLKEKKALLEEYKKGIMQKIFNQELRFKDDNGQDFEEWAEILISELTNVIVGGTPSTIKEEYWNGDIAWLSSGELNNGLVVKAKKYITGIGLKNSSAKLMKPNTVLLAMTGATLGKIGFLTFESCGNQSIAGFEPNNKFVSKFFYYNLLFNKNLILSMAGGAAQQGINKASIESLYFSFPNIKEQTIIANFLSSIDEKIELVATQISDTQEYKKGLLQQMFI